MNIEEKLGLNNIDLKYNEYLINHNESNYCELIRSLYEYCSCMYDNIFVNDEFELNNESSLITINDIKYIPIYSKSDYSNSCTGIKYIRLSELVESIINSNRNIGLILNYNADNYICINTNDVIEIYEKSKYIIDLSYESNVGIKITFSINDIIHFDEEVLLNSDTEYDINIFNEYEINNKHILIKFKNEDINLINEVYLESIFNVFIKLSRNNKLTIYTKNIDLYLLINEYFETYCNKINESALRNFKEKMN